MKRFFSILCVCWCALSVSALTPDGNTRGTAFPFDWENGHTQASTTTGVSKWYRVDISEMMNLQRPALALYSTNLSSTETVKVKAVIYPEIGNGSLSDWSFTLAPGTFRIESEDFSALTEMGFQAVYILLTTSGSSANCSFTVKMYEWERVKEDRDCQRLTMTKIGGSPLAGGVGSRWYTFALPTDRSQDVYVRIQNTGSAEATYSGDLSYDCPCTGKTAFSRTIAAGEMDSVKLPVNVMEAIAEDHAYIRVDATGVFAISIRAYSATATSESMVSATPYDWNTPPTVVAGSPMWISVPCDSLTQMLYVPELTLRAVGGATVTAKMAYAPNGALVELAQYDWTFSGDEETIVLDVNELMALPAAYRQTGMIYFCLTTTAAVTMQVDLNDATHSTDCLTAIDFDYVNGTYIEANTSTWLHVSMANAVTLHRLMQPHCTNTEDKHADVRMELTFQCPYDEYYSFTGSLDPYETSPEFGLEDAWIPYEMYGEADEFWLRIYSNTRLYLSVTRHDDPAAKTTVTDYEEFRMNEWYTVPSSALSEKWFHYPISTFNVENREYKDALPLLTVINGEANPVKMHVKFAYNNPFDYTPAQGTFTLEANEHIMRRATQDLVDHYLGRYDDIYFEFDAKYENLGHAVAADDSIRYKVQMFYPTREILDTIVLNPCGGDVVTVEDTLYHSFEPFDFYKMDTMFTVNVSFSNDTIARGDSVRTFVVHALHTAMLPQPLTLHELPALGIEPGAVLDQSFRDAVLAQFWPLVEADSLAQPDKSTVVWDYMKLPDPNYPTDACADTAAMYIRMSYVDGCDNLLTDTFEVAFRRHIRVVHIVTETTLTACEGETVVDTRFGSFPSFVMPANDTTFADQVRYDDTNVCGDSLRYYTVLLRQPIMKEVEEQTVCTNQTYTWHGRTLSAAGTYGDTVRYASGCDSVIYTLELDMREDYFDVNDDYESLAPIRIPAYLKYGNSMLMLDLRELNKNLLAVGREMLTDSSLVSWYKVRGEVDLISAGGILVRREGDKEDDLLLGHGYYTTVDPSISAAYYACLSMDNLQSVCGVVYRSQLVSSLLESNVVSLAPSRTQRGGLVRVEGCEGMDCTVRVFSMLGALVQTETFAAGDACEFVVSGANTGCYFVEVRTSESSSTHRLVIE